MATLTMLLLSGCSADAISNVLNEPEQGNALGREDPVVDTQQLYEYSPGLPRTVFHCPNIDDTDVSARLTIPAEPTDHMAKAMADAFQSYYTRAFELGVEEKLHPEPLFIRVDISPAGVSLMDKLVLFDMEDADGFLHQISTPMLLTYDESEQLRSERTRVRGLQQENFDIFRSGSGTHKDFSMIYMVQPNSMIMKETNTGMPPRVTEVKQVWTSGSPNAACRKIDNQVGMPESEDIQPATPESEGVDPSEEPWVLTHDGFGPLHRGETISPDLLPYFTDSGECIGPVLEHPEHGQIEVWTEEGNLSGPIDGFALTGAVLKGQGAATATGARLGTTLAELKALYPTLETPTWSIHRVEVLWPVGT